MLKIELNQSNLRGGQRLPRRRVQRMLRAVSKELEISESAVVSVGFVSEKEMRSLNKSYRGKNSVTDVLAFPLPDDAYQGEVLVCYPQAVRQAKEMKHSTQDEVFFLLVHGILHVFGYDHIRPKDRRAMFAHQAAILTSLHIDPRV